VRKIPKRIYPIIGKQLEEFGMEARDFKYNCMRGTPNICKFAFIRLC